MDVGNQLLKPEVVLDWAMIGERAPATEHSKQLHIHPALPQHPCPTSPFTKQEQQIISPRAVCFHWGFILLVKPQPTALRGSLQCCGYSPHSHLGMMERCFPSLHTHAHTDHYHAPILAVHHVHTPWLLMMFIFHWFQAERKVLPECLKDALDVNMPCANLQRAALMSLYLEG